jgi:hypothetical protein
MVKVGVSTKRRHNSATVTQNSRRSANLRPNISETNILSGFYSDALLALRQICTDQPRKIWTLVRGASGLADQATLFEFATRQPTNGDSMTVIKQFISFAINENSPMPWCTHFHRALGANVRGAITRDGIVPTRLICWRVNSLYVFQRPFTRYVSKASGTRSGQLFFRHLT